METILAPPAPHKKLEPVPAPRDFIYEINLGAASCKQSTDSAQARHPLFFSTSRRDARPGHKQYLLLCDDGGDAHLWLSHWSHTHQPFSI
jgi:hypothetical protein